MKNKSKAVYWALASFALFLFFGINSSMAQWNVDSADDSLLPDTSIYDIIYNLMQWILGIFGFLSIIAFVVSGIMYLMSAGDQDASKRAKTYMTYSIYGVIIGLAGLVIITAIDAALWGDMWF